jgi:ABC-type polar amino acid transport system ATPase subunit
MSLPMAHLARLLEQRLRNRATSECRNGSGGDGMIRVTGLRKQLRRLADSERDRLRSAPQTVLGSSARQAAASRRCCVVFNGLETIDGGTIECDDVCLEAESPRGLSQTRARAAAEVGTVFQHFYPVSRILSVLGNIIEAPVHVLRTAA